MTKDEQQKLLAEMSKNQYGQALKSFLDEHIAEIRDVMDSKSWEETQGRQFAVKLLETLFSFMEHEKSEPRRKPRYD